MYIVQAMPKCCNIRCDAMRCIDRVTHFCRVLDISVYWLGRNHLRFGQLAERSCFKTQKLLNKPKIKTIEMCVQEKKFKTKIAWNMKSEWNFRFVAIRPPSFFVFLAPLPYLLLLLRRCNLAMAFNARYFPIRMEHFGLFNWQIRRVESGMRLNANEEIVWINHRWINFGVVSRGREIK